MQIIGLTGSIGSGKSTVGKMMEKGFSVKLVMTDNLGHKMMEKGTVGYKEIISVFGEDILDEDGNIDRNLLGKIVFQDEEKLQGLNHIIHPKVREYLEKDIKKEQEAGKYKYYVMESAILFQSGIDELCHECWYVDAEETVRRKRLMENRGYSSSKIDAIMEKQIENEKYKMSCKQKIDNNHDLQAICDKLEKLLV